MGRGPGTVLALSLVVVGLGAHVVPQAVGITAEIVQVRSAAMTTSALEERGTPADATSYAFARTTEEGAPVTWNRCAPVPVVINPAGAPAGAVEEVVAALNRIGTVSGLDMVYAGTTDAEPVLDWGERPYPGADGWPPVLVAWASPSSGLIDDAAAGTAHTFSAGRSYVSGLVVIHEGQDAIRSPGFSEAGARGSVYLHELAHVVGLAHVDDHGQLMHPTAAASPLLGAGDRAGLAAVGSQPCLSAPPAPW